MQERRERDKRAGSPRDRFGPNLCSGIAQTRSCKRPSLPGLAHGCTRVSPGALPKRRGPAQVRTLTPGNCGSTPPFKPHGCQPPPPPRTDLPAGPGPDLEPCGRTRARRPHRAAPAAYNMAPPTPRPPRGRRHLARSHDPGPSEAACDWAVGRRPSMAAADWPRAGGRGPALVAGAADGGGGSSMAAGLSGPCTGGRDAGTPPSLRGGPVLGVTR